jgi:hypothetical protein
MRNRLLSLAIGVIVVVCTALYRWKAAAWHSEVADRPAISTAVRSEVSLDQPSQIAPGFGRVNSVPRAPAQLHATFRKAQQCANSLSTIGSLKSLSNCTDYDGKPEFAKAYSDCLEDAAAAQANLTVAQNSMVGCGERKGLVRRYFEAAKSAAEAGDTDAQMCIVYGAFDTQNGDFAYTDAEKIEYNATAPRYIDAALHRGDWRVVALLSTRVVDWAGPWAFLDQWQDPARAYKAQRLLRLGAEGDYAGDLENSYSSGQYSKAITTVGDAWAQEMYERYFSSQSKLTKEPNPCSLEDSTH